MNILNTNCQSIAKSDDIKQDICLIAVLTEGIIGDLAVYQAIVPYPYNIAHEEYAASLGNKLRYKEAICHFPGLTKESYRA